MHQNWLGTRSCFGVSRSFAYRNHPRSRKRLSSLPGSEFHLQQLIWLDVFIRLAYLGIYSIAHTTDQQQEQASRGPRCSELLISFCTIDSCVMLKEFLLHRLLWHWDFCVSLEALQTAISNQHYQHCLMHSRKT